MYVVQLWPSTCTPCPRTTTTFFVLVHLLQLVSWSYLAISVRNVAVLANVIQIWCLCMKRSTSRGPQLYNVHRNFTPTAGTSLT